MPSPPAPVSSAHQPAAAATDAGSVVSTSTRRVAREDARVGGDQPVGEVQVPGVRLGVVGGPSRGEQLERREPDPVQPVGRPAVAPVGGGEGGGVGRPGPGAREQARPRRARPRPPARAPRRRPGSAARAAAPDRRVLVPQQLPGLGAPGQQLGVEQQPGRCRARRTGRPSRRRRAAGRRAARCSGSVEERPAGAGPHRAERVTGRAEPGPGRVIVTADERDRARAHVLLLAHHLVDAVGPEGVERLVRVLEQVRAGRGGDRAHGRRQVEQPARVDREPAHHLQRGGRVLLADPDPPLVARLDDPASGDVGDVEDVGLAVSGRRRLARGAAG